MRCRRMSILDPPDDDGVRGRIRLRIKIRVCGQKILRINK